MAELWVNMMLVLGMLATSQLLQIDQYGPAI